MGIVTSLYCPLLGPHTGHYRKELAVMLRMEAYRIDSIYLPIDKTDQ
ncbi:hypothetical protein M096_1369 [Parabacteroides distasonis str. 3999B T(B) 6]|nr:hypothetical protein M096_1369 [Parabacteroides distasonis str. 3999B T(B) 6]